MITELLFIKQWRETQSSTETSSPFILLCSNQSFIQNDLRAIYFVLKQFGYLKENKIWFLSLSGQKPCSIVIQKERNSIWIGAVLRKKGNSNWLSLSMSLRYTMNSAAILTWSYRTISSNMRGIKVFLFT